ncbi:MAG TPA: hypothetical protein VHZ07_05705 [Bryobacteraceae bacterium]|nr:hypothetical protein [Bryobacteraceae bacterium]
MANAILLLGVLALCFSASLCVRAYMPCPFGDEWWVITDIARGKGPQSLAWLWSQHNEHRIVITRLLIWLDLFVFGGTNKSLFIEIFVVQLLHWSAIAWVVERWTSFDLPVRRTLQGLFAFCLFHPNQYENFTWAFQISFVLPFGITTLALLAISFYEQLQRRVAAAVFIAIAPLLAALNMAGGIMAAPVLLMIGAAKRMRPRLLAAIGAAFTFSAVAYFWGHHPPDPSFAPALAMHNPTGILLYVLTYFGASWTKLLSHKERIVASASLIVYIGFVIRSFRARKIVSNFEWFCLGECTLALGVAFVTALGRLHLGPGQAFASRYQTVAMIYWAALYSLVFLWALRRWPRRVLMVEVVAASALLLSALTWRNIWSSIVPVANERQRACVAVIHDRAGTADVRTLDIDAGLEPAATFLRKLWEEPAHQR